MDDEQKRIYTDIMDAIYETKGSSKHQIFFIDALEVPEKHLLPKLF